MYLPSLGFCMVVALALSAEGLPFEDLLSFVPARPTPNAAELHARQAQRRNCARWLLTLLLTVALSQKCHERSHAWANQVALWGASHTVNPQSVHSCQNYAINLSLNNQALKAATVLESTRAFPEVDRVDTDEIYPMLALTLRLLGRWEVALHVLRDAWERLERRVQAHDRGVRLWHMHDLADDIDQFGMRRARLLGAYATVMQAIDLRQAALLMAQAVVADPGDKVVRRLAVDVEDNLRRIVERHNQVVETLTPDQQQEVFDMDLQNHRRRRQEWLESDSYRLMMEEHAKRVAKGEQPPHVNARPHWATEDELEQASQKEERTGTRSAAMSADGPVLPFSSLPSQLAQQEQQEQQEAASFVEGLIEEQRGRERLLAGSLFSTAQVEARWQAQLRRWEQEDRQSTAN